jgi:hypothetical protein
MSGKDRRPPSGGANQAIEFQPEAMELLKQIRDDGKRTADMLAALFEKIERGNVLGK